MTGVPSDHDATAHDASDHDATAHDATAPGGARWLTPARRVLMRRFFRYAVNSALATFVSAVAFAVVYRPLGLGPRVASGGAFAAGALVNFVGNRFWTWQRVRRRGLGRDAVAYLAIAVTTALGAAGVTSLTEWYCRRAGVSATDRAVLVEASYFATYAAVFLVKFVLLDRLVFGSRGRAGTPG